MMTMVENGTFDSDRKEAVHNVGLGLNSPWKKPVEKPADSPVMGEKTWPALSVLQIAKSSEISNSDAQAKPISDVHKKPNGGVGGNSATKYGQQRYHRGGPKRNPSCGPPFPVPVVRHPYYSQGGPVPVPPPIPGQAHGYAPMAAPYPGVDNRSGKSGSQIPMNAFGGTPIYQPAPQADLANNAPKNSVGAKPCPTEGGVPGGNMYRRWQRPKGGIVMQQNMPPGAHMRPAFFRPGPFVRGPAFPGPVHMHYHPMPPPGWIQAPLYPGFAPRPVNPSGYGLPPELLDLREKIVKQIEYYFSDENLLTDHYLISQMDDHGWVPISLIADFKRVKRMCTDTRFILDALQQSTSVEVEGNMVRKRKCPVEAESDAKVNQNSPSEEKADPKTGDDIGSPSESDSKADVFSSSDSDTFDASIANAVVTTTLEINCSAANVDKLSTEFASTVVT